MSALNPDLLHFIKRVPTGQLESTYYRLVDQTQRSINDPILVAEMIGVRVDARPSESVIENAQRHVCFTVREFTIISLPGEAVALKTAQRDQGRVHNRRVQDVLQLQVHGVAL